MADEFGVPKENMYKASEPELITGPQAEKLVAQALRGDFNDKLLEKPPGKLVMAPESDSKPAVEVGYAAADFSDDEDEL